MRFRLGRFDRRGNVSTLYAFGNPEYGCIRPLGNFDNQGFIAAHSIEIFVELQTQLAGVYAN